MTARRPQTGRLANLLLDLLRGIWQVLVGLLAFTGLAVIAVSAAWLAAGGAPVSRLDPKVALDRVWEPVGAALAQVEPEPTRPVVVYLNREGATLVGGRDDPSRNTSSVVAHAGLETFEVPAFQSTAARWDAIVSCVEDQFEAYDLTVVDRRPVEGPYVMVMVGGQPGGLAASDGRYRGLPGNLSGLAPMAERPMDEAVAFVFSRTLREQTRAVCETVAHEVGHVFGLDHAMDCRDPMSYLPRCAPRSFQQREVSCGERAERLCADGEASQSSHLRLLEVLGARPAPDARAASR